MTSARSDEPTLLGGLRGVFSPHPWLDRASAEFDLDEDVFSLAVRRAEAYVALRAWGGAEPVLVTVSRPSRH
ncbi:hypothetical protein [Streptomyces hebeiensis]